ncbi:membrane protein [Actinoplanes sp. SE50]|uniref:membrane protein n=1 Tax=unclassified Actinoplanes TaxID=2626549 RepID=UPI00023EC334|nr:MULTISPECIES: membrane protein [unclassified Actinoplanes]AEV86978.1 integral membrane protein [Actinoplanes sp. SE50/110]ATO85374.1 membrane protein [Actinoplanes sp. SE50]SLM02786.1 membrane protein [Actinoplanes sp. SE50/110]
MTLLDHVRRPAVLAGLLAGVLGLVWTLWFAHDAGDLAAQYAWTSFVREHPWSAYNMSWYGGMHPASYSVISPYLMAWLGVRTTGVLACTAGAALGGLALTRFGVRRPLLPSVWLAIAVWANLAAGRVTYLLGMVFALMAALLAPPRSGPRPDRPVLAAALGALATLCSPVAGLFIEVLAAALFLVGRRRRAYLLAAGPPVVIAATSLLFPFSGVQPFPWYAALATVAAAVAVGVLTPPAWRTVRAGAWVYAVGVALCWALPTPIGSNVERLALLVGALILFCAAPARRTRRATVTYLAAAALAVWTMVQPVSDVIHTSRVTDRTAADARPLITELLRLDAQRSRVEVVPLRTHWEASVVAPYIALARGWNRQADVERNPLFYDDTLTPDSYRAWLTNWSVAYVVLPAMEPDSSGIAEAQIITAGQPWLPLVWQDADWRVYRVEGADPLVSAPATVVSAGPAALTVHMPQAGSALVRVAWSPWLAIDGAADDSVPRACLARSGEWTELSAPTAGTYTIEARYALSRGTPCGITRHDPDTPPR